MDYASLHGPGISNFSSSETPHRLPTVSAATAVAKLKSSPTRYVSTGLADLDAVLQNAAPGSQTYGGLSRGKVTEVFGPPGVGKTAFGMQVAAGALHSGGDVVWVDAAHPLPGHRFSNIISSFEPPPTTTTTTTTTTPQSPPKPPNDPISNLTHFATPTLAHLLALTCNPTPTFPPQNTTLLVIDSLSTLLNTAFPRHNAPNPSQPPKKPGSNPSARKIPIVQTLLKALQTLALTRNIAILVLSQCGTRMRSGAGAVLVPAISIPAWDQGLGARILLLRDFGWTDDTGNLVHDVRLAEVVKAEGAVIEPSQRRFVGFSVTEAGLVQLALPVAERHSPAVVFSSPALPRVLKRKRDAAELEIPDSEDEGDEDYGWEEEDEGDMPAMPPQWQGSEDILIPPPGELEGEEEEDESALEEEGGDDEEARNSADELAL